MSTVFLDLSILEKLDKIERLLSINARRSVIEGLIPEVRGDRMIRDRMNASRRRMMANEGSPRGKSHTAASPKFLSRNSDRYQASILIALANRISLPPKGTVEHAEHLATVYKLIGETVIGVTDKGRLSFNDFAIAMEGIENGHLVLERCGECNSMFVKKRCAVGRAKSCPICDCLTLSSHRKACAPCWIVETGAI